MSSFIRRLRRTKIEVVLKDTRIVGMFISSIGWYDMRFISESDIKIKLVSINYDN